MKRIVETIARAYPNHTLRITTKKRRVGAEALAVDGFLVELHDPDDDGFMWSAWRTDVEDALGDLLGMLRTEAAKARDDADAALRALG